MFVKNWSQPDGGIHGYLKRFVLSGDPTFMHIAIWTLLQLLQSGDKQLRERIASADEMVQTIQNISERHVESDDEEREEGEGEVAALARRCLELLGKAPKTLAEG